MASIFPPVLSTQAGAMNQKNNQGTQNDWFFITFQMPSFNSLSDIGHVQVTIKKKNNGLSAINSDYTPDGMTMFIGFNTGTQGQPYQIQSRDDLDGAANTGWLLEDTYFEHLIYNFTGTNVYEIRLPYKIFTGERPDPGTEYIVQVRFGIDDLSGLIVSGHSNNNQRFFFNLNDKDTSTNYGQRERQLFASWRKQQVSQIPSNFGEWSNVSSVYCLGTWSLRVTETRFDDFFPQFKVLYETNADFPDPLESIKIIYKYWDEDGETLDYTTIFPGEFSQTNSGDSLYSQDVKVYLAPLIPIYISIECTTKYNNRNVGIIKTIAAISPQNADSYSADSPMAVFNSSHLVNGGMTDYTLVGEELDEGCIAKSIVIDETIPKLKYINVYRINLHNYQTIKVLAEQEMMSGKNNPFIFKDFSAEMGEPYEYVVAIVDTSTHKITGILRGQTLRPVDTYWSADYERQMADLSNLDAQTFFGMYPYGYNNHGYAMLDRLDSVYLSSEKHQLRIAGNITISSLKRNTSDVFQTTIGSKYPYYSRLSQVNYRSFSLSGVISIHFDQTSTFLERDLVNGLYWIDEDTGKKKLVVANEYMFTNEQFSLSRQRRINNGQTVGINAAGKVHNTIFDKYLFRDIMRINTTDPTSKMIYQERKFRDYVMSWLSDGKPKLFRSETEGNMIVICSGISFSPFDKNRMVYSVQMTCTEIDEYNLENLRKYNLVPIAIRAYRSFNFPQELVIGDVIQDWDYRTLEYYFDTEDWWSGLFTGVADTVYTTPAGTNSFYFWQVASTGNNLQYLGLLNSRIRNLNEWSFIRGTFDPWIDTTDGLILQYSTEYDIPLSEVDLPIQPINYDAAVLNGAAPYTWSVVRDSEGLSIANLFFREGQINGYFVSSGDNGYLLVKCTDANGLEGFMWVKRGIVRPAFRASVGTYSAATFTDSQRIDNYGLASQTSLRVEINGSTSENAELAGNPISPIDIITVGGVIANDMGFSEDEN